MSTSTQVNYNPYNVLMLDENASFAEVRAQYKKLCKKFHPDANPGDEEAANKMMAKINQAYSDIKNGWKPYTSEQFDAAVAEAAARARAEEAAARARAEEAARARQNASANAGANARGNSQSYNNQNYGNTANSGRYKEGENAKFQNDKKTRAAFTARTIDNIENRSGVYVDFEKGEIGTYPIKGTVKAWVGFFVTAVVYAIFWGLLNFNSTINETFNGASTLYGVLQEAVKMIMATDFGGEVASELASVMNIDATAYLTVVFNLLYAFIISSVVLMLITGIYGIISKKMTFNCKKETHAFAESPNPLSYSNLVRHNKTQRGFDIAYAVIADLHVVFCQVFAWISYLVSAIAWGVIDYMFFEYVVKNVFDTATEEQLDTALTAVFIGTVAITLIINILFDAFGIAKKVKRYRDVGKCGALEDFNTWSKGVRRVLFMAFLPLLIIAVVVIVLIIAAIFLVLYVLSHTDVEYHYYY